MLKCFSLAAHLIHLKVHAIHALVPASSCDHLIAVKEVNQIAQVIENNEIRLHLYNAISTRMLIKQLAIEGTHTFYKDKQDHVIDLRLPQDAFVLCIQMSFQLDAFQHLGSSFIGIDATHNITQYQDLLLFMIIARDCWGHGK